MSIKSKRLLLEILNEEIPSEMQIDGAKQLLKNTLSNIKAIAPNQSIIADFFVTPRRIGFVIDGLDSNQIVNEEIKGPKISAPDSAIEGFLKKYNIASVESLQKQGEYYLFNKVSGADDFLTLLAEAVQKAILSVIWPKSMKWSDYKINWIRPIHKLICMLDDQIIDIKVGHITSSNVTIGHQSMSSGPIVINHALEYEESLRRSFVEINPYNRIDVIKKSLMEKARELKIKLIEDENLLIEVAGLVEWPTVSIGKIDEEFLSLPREVLITTLRHHQKYFMFQDDNGEIAPYFGIVANIVAPDGNSRIIAGNQRVLKARLSDAAFFLNQDKMHSLESRLELLKKIAFHNKIGSVYDKMLSTKEIAVNIAAKIGANQLQVKRAAELMKADLVTEMVKEFPELQGIMGYHYAIHDKEDIEVAKAIRDHYKPKGQSDTVPTDAVTVALALAEKLDTLNQMFAHNIKPTSSKDPFALRRAAIGILLIQKANSLELDFADMGVSEEVINFIKDREL